MIRNNIFAFATHGQIVRTRDETHRSFICQRNIVYYTQGEPLGDNFRLGQHQFDYNCYWNAAGKTPIFPGGLSFQQWQAKRQDVHSIVADPKFFDAERFDFRLKADSPALQAGFSADRHERDRPDRAGRVGGVAEAGAAAAAETAGRQVGRQ